jgi:hypothetical protein
MGEGKIHDPETGGTRGPLPWMDSLAEEGQLEAVLMSLIIGKIPRCVPPLGLKRMMGAMISGKLVLPSRLRFPPFLIPIFLGTEKRGKKDA